MAFTSVEKKGIKRFLIADTLPVDRLSVHRSSLPGGSSSHAPHTHDGVEAFIILNGIATLEAGGEVQVLRASEVLVVDAAVPHAIRNESTEALEYLVVVSR
jgi:quercetin dioxygenase-like cupin family protein